MTQLLLFKNKENHRLHLCEAYFQNGKKEYCVLCQGADKLEQHRGEMKDKGLFVKVLWIMYNMDNGEINTIKREIVNFFCENCYQKKLEDMKSNPDLVNNEVLEKITKEGNKRLKKWEKWEEIIGKIIYFLGLKKVDRYFSKLSKQLKKK